MPGPAAPAPAAGAAPGPAPNPQAAIAAHAAQSGATNPADQAIITRVETAIQNSPMGWLQSQLGEANEKSSDDRAQAEDKASDFRDEVSSNQKDAPADAGPPPQPGQAVRPNVQTPQAAGQGPAGTPGRPGAQGGAQHPQHSGNAGARRGGAGGGAAPSVAATIAGASTEEDLKKALDAYPNKSQDTLGELSRIKQVGDIARGFQGQLDVYVAHSSSGLASAAAATANWFGIGKNVNAIWDNNPYKNSNDTLGRIMTGLSVIKQVTGIVGSICGKLGLILTVVGLLGMIFPPIGTAVSGIARVLNVIGIICDAISFVISAILTGLNGVRLAKQIAHGGSAEEKAATADLMVSEANDAAGSAINLAMAFGPKFMKGLMEKSKGLINGLMRRMKAIVGSITMRMGASVRGFAARLFNTGTKDMRLVGGAWVNTAEKGALSRAGSWIKSSRVGSAVGTAWNAPGKYIGKARDALMSRYGSGRFAQFLDRTGARAGNLADRMDITRAAENAGERVGNMNLGRGTEGATRWQNAADQAEQSNKALAVQIATDDAAALERRRIQHELEQRAQGGGNPKRNMEGDNDYLDHGGRQTRRANAAGREAGDEVRMGQSNAAQDAANTANATAAIKADPAQAASNLASQRAQVTALEGQLGAQEAERRALLARGEANLSDAEKKQLETLNSTLQPLDMARNRAQLSESQLYSQASGGGARKDPSTAWDAFNTYSSATASWRKITNHTHSWESKEGFDFKNPTKWDGSGAARNAAGRSGGTYAPTSSNQPQEQRDDFHAFVARQPQQQNVATRVRSLLANVGRRGAPAPAPAPTAAATLAPQPQPQPQPQGQGPTPSPASGGSTPAQPQAHSAPQAQPASGGSAPASGGTPSAGASPGAGATPTDTHGGATPGGGGGDAHAGPDPAAAGGPGAAGPGAGGPGAAGPGAAGPGAAGADDPGALPYWPKLLDASGDDTYAHALSEFGFMRRVAVEFKNAQNKGKQEAVDTLETYGRYREYAQARQAAAQQHQTETQATGQETQASHQAAAQSQQSGEQGSQKQNEAQNNSHAQTPDLPEPESHGFWARIIGRIKRWAKNKAAQIFGWLQEKIANVILQGLCGVSMGDLRDYSGALRHQQQAAQGVADTGAQTAGQAAQAHVTLQGNVAKEAQSAADSIQQCDQNIGEADRFLADLTQFEGQIRQSAAAAQTFISNVTNEWRAQHQQAQEAQQRAQAAQGPSGGMDAGTPAPAPAPQADPAGQANATPDGGGGGDPNDPNNMMCMPGDGDPSAAGAGAPDPNAAPTGAGHAAPDDVSALHEAATFVSHSADDALQDLNASKSDYLNQLNAAMTNRAGSAKTALHTAQQNADHTVHTFQEQVEHIKAAMNQVAGRSDIPESDVHGLVDTIINTATELDQDARQAHETLTKSFDATFQTIKSSSPHTGVVGAINNVAEPVTEKVQSGIDAGQHAADGAWDRGANVVSAVANPIANAAVDVAAVPVRAAGYVGAAAVAPPPPGVE